MTNQFKMNISKDLSVFQYPIDTIPALDGDDHQLLLLLFKKIRRNLNMCLGGKMHVLAGRTIFSTEDLAEDIVIEVELYGVQYKFMIQTAKKVHWNGDELTQSAKKGDPGVLQNLVNNIIKDAFRSTHLK